MGDGEGEKQSNHKQQKVRFDSACNETHLLECEVSISAASSSSVSSDGSSSGSTITDKDVDENDLTNSDVSSTVSGQPPYDTDRIPSSIFSTGPTTTADWSIASNDSLFSITMGNNSFSRDHGYLLYKSGELMKLDEVFNLPITLPPVAEGEVARADIEGLEPPAKAADDAAVSSGKNDDDIDRSAVPDRSPNPKNAKAEDLRNSARTSTQSDGSAASNSSFAFPILICQDAKNVSNKGDPAKEHTQSRTQQSLPKQSWSQKSSPLEPKTRTLTSWFCCLSCCSFRCSMSLK